MLKTAEGKDATIEDVIAHLQQDGNGDVVVIQVKEDNSSFTFSSGALPDESGDFQTIERFRLIGILESAKEFAKNFSNAPDIVDHILDELDFQISGPQLEQNNLKIGDAIQMPKEGYDKHMAMRKEIQDRGLEIASSEEGSDDIASDTK